MKLSKSLPRLRWLLGLGGVAFGLATVVSGGRVLFGDALVQAESGNVVTFVLVFNFISGFVYVATGIATVLRRRWSLLAAGLLATATLLVFAALGVHIAQGGAFETRTVAAMTLRSVFWIGQTAALAYIFKNESGTLPDSDTHARIGDA